MTQLRKTYNLVEKDKSAKTAAVKVSQCLIYSSGHLMETSTCNIRHANSSRLLSSKQVRNEIRVDQRKNLFWCC